jgi:hypothetical protein
MAMLQRAFDGRLQQVVRVRVRPRHRMRDPAQAGQMVQQLIFEPVRHSVFPSCQG